MARKVIHQLIDDIDGTVLAPGAGESVSFSLDGKSYEIDLTSENAANLRDAVKPYISAGRRATGAAKTRARASSASGSRDLSAVRKWARANGYTVSDRGRVAAPILEAYDAAH